MSSGAPVAAAERSSHASRAAALPLQAKLSVGRSNDTYEAEADRVAGAVTARNSAPGQAPAIGGAPAAVSRRVAPKISRLRDGTVGAKAEKEEPQAKLQRQEEEEPQAKLQRQEEEEPQAKLQRQEEEEPQAKLQRQEEEEVQAAPEPRANVRDKRMFPPLGRVEGKLFDNKGKGEALDDDTRIAMETGFGADFSGVRVHTGADAVQMARDLKAQAFTHGNDVFFNSGKFEPESTRGRGLLAHELTHVVQQGAAEQRVPEGRVESNNARRNEPPPQPADRHAQQVEDTTRARIEADQAGSGAAAGTEVVPQGAATGPAVVPQDATASAASPEATAPQAPAGREGASEAAAGEAAVPEVAAPEAAAEGAQGAEGTKSAEGMKDAKGEKAAKGEKDERSAKGKTAPRGKKGAGKEAGARAAGKGGGVGAFLRRVTQGVFEAKKQGIRKLAGAQKKKDPAEAKLAQTEKAVVPPAEEAQSRAKATQVEAVEKAPEPRPDEAQAKQQFDAKLQAAVPATLEEVDEFKEEGKGRIVGESVKEVVAADTQQVQGTYQEIDNPPPPAAPETTPEELPAVEAPEETAAIAPGEGVVGEVQPEHTDVSEFEEQSDAQLEQEGIKEEHLEMVDEGELAEANKERKNLKTQVAEGPKEVKQLEQQQKQEVGKELQKEEQQARQGMHAERQKGLSGAREDQHKTKSKLELARQKVTDHVNGIYQRANETVKKKLEELETRSLKDFETGEKQATKSFEDNVKRRIDAVKQRRYDRFGGSLLWAKDKLFGMDDLPEVKGIFDSEKSAFVTAIDALIAKITAENKRVIGECKEIVANAKAEIEKYVAGLGPALRETGQTALKDIKTKLAALDQQINDKEKELQKKLAEKREAAIKAIEEKIENMKEEMSGLVSKLGNLLLNAMLKFFKWALKKAGMAADRLMGIINKGKAVIKKIVGDPIGFIGNLVKAAKDGVGLFVTNIKKHLIAGLISWLTGAMADVPIQLPESWDLKGIIYLVLQILGLTWQNIRAKLVKRLGERVVAIAETTVEIVKLLITKGPIALWEMIKAKAAEIKQQVMDGIRNWVIVQVVKQAVIKLISFLNPAGAIVQAILAIYNVVMFFVENIERILAFVTSLFDSIADIAMGKLSAAAQVVERAMAMTIPIILNFLARLIGLSGIGKAVSNIITKVRKPIDKVVDKVVDKIAGFAKKLMAKAKKGLGKMKDKIVSWWRAKVTFKGDDGKTHKLFFKGTGRSAKLYVASDAPLGVEQMIEKRRKEASKKPLSPAQRDALTAAKKKKKELDQFVADNTKTSRSKGTSTVDIRPQINTRLTEIRALLVKGDIFPKEKDLPLTNVTHQMSAGKARVVKAEPLTKLAGNSTGQNVSSGSGPSPLGWDFAQQTQRAGSGSGKTSGGSARRSVNWVRMHLLAHQLHGPATTWNLAPAHQSVNSNFEAIEADTAKALKSGEEWSYTTTVHYKSNKPIAGAGVVGDEGHYPVRVEVALGKKKSKGDGYALKTKNVTGTFPVPGPPDAETLFAGLQSSVRGAVERAHEKNETPTWAQIDYNLHITDPRRPKPWLTEANKTKLVKLVDKMNKAKGS